MSQEFRCDVYLAQLRQILSQLGENKIWLGVGGEEEIFVDGAVQGGVQAASRSGSAVVYAPASSQDVLTEVLKGTVNIAPTVVKRNGDRIQVFVARDVDFRSVYELRAVATGR